MPKEITAAQIVGLIKKQLNATWKDTSQDVFNAGKPDTIVTGIATSFTPSIEVLRQAVTTGKNLIITQQPAYYLETEEYLKGDQAFEFKRDFIDKNGLVIWRFYDNWKSRSTDGQLLGLAKALDWDKYHIHNGGGEPYARENKYFNLPDSSLKDKVIDIQGKLKIRGIRVIGRPETRVRKAALSHGMFKLAELQEFMKEPDVDLIVIAEAIEWESCEYFRDMLAWKGYNKAMILIGREASEDPGYNEVASWLKTFITKVPVDFISAQEPFGCLEISSKISMKTI